MNATNAGGSLRAAIGLIAGISLVATLAMPVLATGGDPHKATICHATSSETNPYVKITVDYAAIDGDKKNDHSHHTGPVWYAGAKADNVDWGDIIPPVDGVNPGQNWTEEGQAIYNADCQIPDEPEEQFGQIVIDKVTDPAQSAESFAFSINQTEFSLHDGEGLDDIYVPGTYVVTEHLTAAQKAAGWSLANITCTDTTTLGDDSVTLSLEAEESIECTFTNRMTTREPTPTPTPAPQTGESCPAPTTLLVTFDWNDGAFVPVGGDPHGVSVTGDADLAYFVSSGKISALVVSAGEETRNITLDFPSTTGSISPHNYEVFGGASISSLGFCVGPKVNPDSGSRVSVEIKKSAECATQNSDGTATVTGQIEVDNHGRWAARVTSALDTILSKSDQALARTTLDDLVGVELAVDEVVTVDYAITFQPGERTEFVNFVEITIERVSNGEARHKIYNARAAFELCEEGVNPTPTPTPTPRENEEGGNPTPTPTPRENEQGGNPTPAPGGGLPDTAVNVTPVQLPALALGLVAVLSLGALLHRRLAEVSAEDR
ncbi:MAG: hypothetical protein ABIO99_09530 [Candidatus Limnocylindria bacterium]